MSTLSVRLTAPGLLGVDADVSRWPDSIPFFLPGWDWGKNIADPKATLLKFPRVLATHVNRTTATQPVDGNLGLAVPG